jgi:hypothetical protein
VPVLTIRADELIMAFEDNNPDAQHFFDRQTGEVLSIFTDLADEEEQQELLDADPDRYVRLDPVPSWVGYEIMSDFLETLPESKVRRELSQALERKRPFRRFKDVLLNYPEVEEDWFRFHEQAFIKIIQEWLDVNDLEVILVPFYPEK